MFRKKSLLALLLSLCMVVGILPATAFAAGQYVPENPRWSGYGNQVMWDKPANASGSTYLEYEAELVVVIGRHARHVTPEQAPDYILGYTVGNDVTARDLQSPTGQWAL